MFFNSINFALFLPIVFMLYWFVANKNLKFQNGLLLVSSYFFYGCWDWRFLFLLIFSTFLDYFTGIKMCEAKNQESKKFWFWLSISVNLGFLGVFKYYDFFAQSFASAISNFGLHVSPFTLNVILPVGISFYTFHGLSYVIDIYKGRIKSEKNFIDYAVFVSFFPLLVAGPIERATHLLPQIKKKRTFDYAIAVDGLRQILWGLFKKIVIADQCAQYVNIIFGNSADYSGSTLVLGAYLFAFQIYGDFSGYSDIAIGTARLFGIDLLKNFAFPFFSRDMAEFFRRWHISLFSWFRDYLYVPLAGRRVGLWIRIRNTFIIFLVSGFWHGANWNFIFWGFLNAIYILPSLILKKNRANRFIVAKGKLLPTFGETVAMFKTFSLMAFGCIFFRSKDMSHALNYVSGIFSKSVFSIPEIKPTLVFVLIVFFMTIEWFGRETNYGIEKFALNKNFVLRRSFYFFLIILILWFSGNKQEFIYFQF